MGNCHKTPIFKKFSKNIKLTSFKLIKIVFLDIVKKYR